MGLRKRKGRPAMFTVTHRFTTYSIEFAVVNTFTGEVVSGWHFGDGARTDANALCRRMNQESRDDAAE